VQAGHELALVLTQPDRPAGRGLKAGINPVKRLALERDLEVFQPHTLGTDSSARIRAARPDALVVAAYGLIFPQAVLDAAAQGALNIHASLLPRWRGAAPIQRAILAGDAQTGISIMQMDAGLDTGAVLAQSAVAIAPDDDAGTLHDKLAALGAEMIVTTLAEVQAGRARALPQPQQGVTYANKLAKHETLLDWSRPADELERAVRALRPSPGAATLLDGVPLKLWRATVTAGRGTPGELLSSSEAGLVVASGEGALAITQLQRPGGRRLAAGEFLRGYRLAPGVRFG
jgi:methionyl-tRNA formyltransferase